MSLNPGGMFPDWTYRPPPDTAPGLPGLPGRQTRPRPAQPPAPAACDCGAKLDALLKVLSLPEGLRGLVLALASAPDADALGVLADYLEERMDPRTGRFRGLARRARGKGGAG